MNRSVLQVFENYQKARIQFVQSIAEQASNPKNVEALQNAGVLTLLRPLLLDPIPSIQHNAAQALGRIASYSDKLALALVQQDILPQLVYSLSEQNRFYKKAASFVLRSVAKHNAELATAVVESGAVEALCQCLEEFDPGVKEAAAWALGYIARHNAELAQAVVDAGAVPLLVICLQEPELSLKRIAASTLSDVAKHSPELAQAVVDAGAVAYLAPSLSAKDARLKRQVCSALGQIGKHSPDLAELVVEADVYPAVFDRLKDPDASVRKNASSMIREIVRHTPELTQIMVNAGGIAAVVDYVSSSTGSAALPGIMTLGYIAVFSETLAYAVIQAKGVAPLAEHLSAATEDHIQAACAWSLRQIGKHSSDHAAAVAEANVLPVLLQCYTKKLDKAESRNDDLQQKAKAALKAVISKCLVLSALEPLIDSPSNIQRYVIHQFAKILPTDVNARKDFVTSGSLQKIQRLPAESGSKLKEHIVTINNCFPEEIVRYYSPGYSETLLAKLDEYQTKR